MKYGLSSSVISQIIAVFASFSKVERVVLFGSRAQGTFRDGSDIDLAVLAPTMNSAEFSELWAEVDALPLVFKVDCLHWNELDNAALKEKIMTTGVLFYSP